MATMDAFAGDAFRTTSLSATADKIDYKPSLLGQLGIFTPRPVRTRNVFVDRRDGVLKLIPTSETLEAPTPKTVDGRDAVSLQAVRLADSFTLTAKQVAEIRAFGSESELEAAEAEYLREMARVRDDMELTHEHHRLGALQGILLDADGSTVIYNYFAEFGEAQPAPISFALDVDTTNVRGICQQVKRAMKRAARGSWIEGTTQCHALAGDAFYDGLIDHPNVRATYQNHAAAADLREDKSFDAFTYGGITFHNYRGTDDNSTVAIPVDEAKFFPVNGRDIFTKVMAPHESYGYVNTLGQDIYSERHFQYENNPTDSKYVRGELYSYPLYFCQQPRVLQRGTRT